MELLRARSHKKIFLLLLLLLQCCPPLCLEDFDSNPQVPGRKGFPLPLGESGDKYPWGYSNNLSQCQAWQQGIAIPSQNTALERNQPGKSPTASIHCGQVISKFKHRDKKKDPVFKCHFWKKRTLVAKERVQGTVLRQENPTNPLGKVYVVFCSACCPQCLFVLPVFPHYLNRLKNKDDDFPF